MISGDNNILHRLDEFIKKFYKKKILKGSILVVLFFLLSSFIIIVTEYFAHLNISSRTILFYIGVFSNIIFAFVFLFYPILQLSIKKFRLSNRNAAAIISNYFKEIEDKLINVLELNNEQESNYSKELVLASINKKSKDLEQYNFVKAINKKDILNLAKAVSFLIAIIVSIFFFKPVVITQGAERVVNYNKYYTPKNFFEIEVLNNSLSIEKGNDIAIEILTKGSYIPSQLFIEYGGNEFYMLKVEQNKFTYEFNKVNNDIPFSIVSENYESEKYLIEVIDVPLLLKYYNTIDYPAYTQFQDKLIENSGDLRIPIGSKITWNFDVLYTDSVILEIETEKGKRKEYRNVKDLEYRAMENSRYSISLKNENVFKQKLLTNNIEIIPDLYPGIEMEYFVDTTDLNIYHIIGKIYDDYGVSKLEIVLDEDNNAIIEIPINRNIKSQKFYYMFDKRSVIEGLTDSFFLKVWDNDEINGYKSAKSSFVQIISPELSEKNEYADSKYNELQEKIKKSLFVADKIKREIEEIKKDLINEKTSDWELKQKMENLMKQQKQLEQLTNEIDKINKEKDNFSNSFNPNNEELREKQEEINELMEKLMNDELKDLFKELEELMKNNEELDINNLMKDLDFSYEELEKQLDRNLELLKRFEIEEKLTNQIEELKKLGKEEKDLSKENTSSDDLIEKQNEIKKDFEEIEKEYKEALEKNEELKDPFKLDEFEKDFNEINENLEEIDQELKEGNNRKAKKKQESTGQKMKELSEKMQEMMDNNFSEMIMESYDDLRQVLDNLLTFSFDQEENILKLENINVNDPLYSRIIKKQNDLESNFRIIEDSLSALGERVVAINKIIGEELYIINSEFKKLEELVESRNRSGILQSQQFIMTSTNNLALLLEEILNNMQNSMGSGKGGSNSKKKKPSAADQMQDLRKSQESLKQQLQNMINQMKNSKNSKSPGSNKSLSEMLAKQEIFQKMLQDIMNGQSIGNDVKRKLEEVNNLIEQNRRDLINRKIDRNLLNRQELIVTRLLEAENSEFEREKEKKRKSKENKTKFDGNNNKIFEYKEENYNFNEILNISNLKLKEYYEKKYKDYMLKLTNE